MRSRFRLSTVFVAILLPLGSCSSPGGAPTPGGPAEEDSLPQPGPLARAESVIDVEHTSLELELEPLGKRIEGRARIRLRTLGGDRNELPLDLVGLDVLGVSDVEGRELSFEHDGRRLVVRRATSFAAGEAHEFIVHYAGVPARGLYFRDGLVFTHGQTSDASSWFPCNDTPADRATSELEVTLPAGWTSVAPGSRISVRRLADGRQREHWRMPTPHPAYLSSLVAGRLQTLTSDWHGVPLTFHAPPSVAPLLEANLLESTRAALDLLSEWTGRRYPYSKYATTCVGAFPFGGMENVSATTLTTSVLRDARGQEDEDCRALVVHEVAQQWFGNLFTCRDWSHVWIKEGFGTFATILDRERREGQDGLTLALREAREGYLAADSGAGRRPIVYDRCVEPTDLFTSGHVYQGAALFLQTLRDELGEATFRRGVVELVGAGENRALDTDDVRAIFERVSGVDLERMFEEWLRSPGHPEIEVRWRHDAERERLLLTVNQTHEFMAGVPEAFHFSAWVAVATEHGVRRQRVTVDARRDLVELVSPEPPRWVRFDPGGHLPARIVERMSADEWLMILGEDEAVGGRLDAIEALTRGFKGADTGLRERVAAALEARLADPIPEVRVSAAGALARIEQTTAALRLAALAESDDVAAVRVAALEALSTMVGEETKQERLALARRCLDAGHSWATMGAALELAAAADPVRALEWIDALPSDGGPHGELGVEALDALVRCAPPGLAERLVLAARNESLPPLVRAAATRHLEGVFNAPRVPATLAGLCKDDDPEVARAAVAALANTPLGPARLILSAHYPDARDSRSRRAIEAALRGE